MNRDLWNERYSTSDLVWSVGPNMWVEQTVAGLPPGTALDLGAGEARNALWLAERGWVTTAVDYSQVAMDRARQLADVRLGADAHRLTTVTADLLEFSAEPTFDLVLVVYVHLAGPHRRAVLTMAASALAPAGLLLVVAHDRTNLTDGVGGPQDPALLYGVDDVLADLAHSGLTIERAERVLRPVATEQGTRDAVDVLVALRRPAG